VDDKTLVRQKVLDRLKTFENHEESDRIIFERLICCPEIMRARTVFVYISVNDEVDTMRFIYHMLKNGVRVCVPKIVGDGKMVAVEITNPHDLVLDKFGIPTARDGTGLVMPSVIDVAVVPGIAFTKDGKRLGRGGGYYDRYLPKVRYSIGICRGIQLMKDLPMEEFDVKVDKVITDRVAKEEAVKEDMGKTRVMPIPKRKKQEEKAKKGALSPKMIYWIFVLAMSMLFSGCIIASANEIFSLSYADEEVVFTIPEGASMGEVCDILKDADMIDSKLLFRMFFALTAKGDVLPGEYTANTYYDYRTTTKLITRKGGRQVVKVTIPEGYESKQIIDLLVKKGVCEREALEEVVKNADFNYSYIKNLKKNDITRLEGYLYPDTYEFYVNSDPKTAIDKMLKNFDTKFNGEYRERAEELGLSIHKVITLASIIEREATGDDAKLVSSVFHNRLASSKYPYLESCATVQYVLPERKERITVEDTKIDSPFNTYMHKGLPPGPIASPGLKAIEAALYPADTEYLFFAVSEDGEHAFSKTYEEHKENANINPN